MKALPALGGAPTDPTTPPTSVQVVRTLGHGRAARAQLVEATMPDGNRITCVEKVFAPGLLTRTIYRLSFQSPFAYQSNRDAILSCFYRRRVAHAVLTASELDVAIAEPIYVRFDQESRAWVLAARWVQGRGIRPAPADGSRLRRRLSVGNKDDQPQEEIRELVETMGQLETLFGECGLVGSGWQVAPRALVSTANLLRTGDRYTIIDLESGIPAVLVPRYLVAGARQAELPPFDDLDAVTLRQWLDQNSRLLTFRTSPDVVHRLREDVAKLIEHSSRWKQSEFALFRRPWRLFTKSGSTAYQQECFRRWRQDGVVDEQTAATIQHRPIKSRLIWYAGLLPSSLGRFCSRLIGRSDYRSRAAQCLRNRESFAAQWQQVLSSRHHEWSAAERIAADHKLTTANFVPNWLLQKLTPAGMHRFLTDGERRRDSMKQLLLLMFNSRYQSWFGRKRIESSIDAWNESQRISDEEAQRLREDLFGEEVRVYIRGFGLHVAVKTFAPIVIPAKYGGVAAFIASGNPWFLLPMLLMPSVRTALTLANWWSSRASRIPHGEALAAGCLPIVGSMAFPLQMFATRPRLSTFLIRDAASKLGQKVPVYGGSDSRTEIAFIRLTDFLVEMMQSASLLTQRLFRSGSQTQSHHSRQTIPIKTRTRFGRWLEREATKQIVKAEQTVETTGEASAEKAA